MDFRQKLTIDDIQHAGMLKDASVAGASAPASLTGTLPASSSTSVHRIQRPERDDREGWIDKRKRSQDQAKASSSVLETPRRSFDSGRSGKAGRKDGDLAVRLEKPSRPGTPDSVTPPGSRSDDPSVSTANVSGTAASRHRDRSTSIVPGGSGLNPSPAKPVTGKDNLTVSSRGASSLVPGISNPGISPSTTKSTAAGNGPSMSGSTSTTASPLSASLARMPEPDTIAEVKASRATVSSLLDQLTEIHDRQQNDRKIEWDAFLRKRRKAAAGEKRAKGAAGEGRRGAEGEGEGEGGGWGGGIVGVIGVAQLGRSGKEEERKAFGKLVRGGIPLTYRSDVWAGK